MRWSRFSCRLKWRMGRRQRESQCPRQLPKNNRGVASERLLLSDIHTLILHLLSISFCRLQKTLVVERQKYFQPHFLKIGSVEAYDENRYTV